MRTKNIPITKEIPKDLGALCQELGAETNIYTSYYFAVSNLYLWLQEEFSENMTFKLRPERRIGVS